MKVHVTVVTDDGKSYAGEVSLALSARGAERRESRRLTRKTASPGRTVSFSGNERAFMNSHGRKKSGPEKFALLVAYLSKGKVGQEVAGDVISTAWNRMTQIMGGAFNGAYATRAKDKGWIDSPKRGAYALSDSWKDVLLD